MTWREAFLEGSRIDWPRVLLLAVTVTAILAIGVAAATSPTAFGPYNPSWDGTSEFRTLADDDPAVESTILRDTATYDDLEANETVVFVNAPAQSYDDADAARVRAFLDAGGTVVVLENFEAPGNDLLEAVGAQARFDGQVLRDERHYHEGPTMPIATGVADHPSTNATDQLTLNYATAVEPGNATPIVSTSGYAYLGNPDDEIGDDAELRPHPVVTVESVGNGEVVAVGDPSIQINAMIDEPDNAAFLQGLYTGKTTVAFDVSHGDGVPPLVSAVLSLRGSAALQALMGLAAIAATALLVDPRGKPLRTRLRRRLEARRKGKTPTETGPALSRTQQAEIVRRRHPDWDDERVERVIGAFNRRDQRGEDDT